MKKKVARKIRKRRQKNGAAKYGLSGLLYRRKTNAEKPFFTEVTGNSVSDHYARNIYIKVVLKIAVLSEIKNTLPKH